MDTGLNSIQVKVKYRATVFRRVLFHHFTFFLIIFSGLAVSLHLLLADYEEVLGAELLGKFTNYAFISIGLTFFITMVYLSLSGYHALLPLKRLLDKARKLRKASLHEIEWSADEQQEDLGEWGELDEALMRIHKSLDKKRNQFRREREELQSIVSTVDDAILAVGHDHTIRYYNSKFAVLFKKKRKEDLPLTFEELFKEESLYTAMGEAFKGKVPRDLHLQLMTSGYGKPRSFRVSVSPLKPMAGAHTFGAVAIFHDETETKLAENVRIEFVANASHELRTPLTSVQGYLQTMKEDLKEGRTAELDKFLDIVIRNVNRLRDLVRDLLEISSLESGSEIQKGSIPVAEVTEMVLHQLDNLRQEKELKVTTSMEMESIYGDVNKVEQVLINLVHNAMKYVPPKTEIRIRWVNLSPHVDGLVVEDDGPGVPLEHQDRLFERFYRIDKGRARELGGTGLGLSIVKHIMLKHGGQVELESSPGEGTRFICRFPKKGFKNLRGE